MVSFCHKPGVLRDLQVAFFFLGGGFFGFRVRRWVRVGCLRFQRPDLALQLLRWQADVAQVPGGGETRHGADVARWGGGGVGG